MRLPSIATLRARVALECKSHKYEMERAVPPYCEDVKYLLEIYATDDVLG